MAMRSRFPGSRPIGPSTTPSSSARSPPGIQVVTGDGMAQRRQVHAYLMRAPGLEVASDQSMTTPALDHPEPSTRRAAAFDDGHAQPVPGIPADRALHDPLLLRQA